MHRLLLLLCLVLPACSLSRTATRVAEQQTRWQGLEERRAVLGSRVLRYWIGGQGPPLLLLHGFGGNGLWTWKKQLGPLSRHHTLVVPDLLWFGESHVLGPVQPGLEQQARAMAALLEHEGIDEADVMGISYGGFVALLLHQLHPDRVGRTVIVDSPGPVFDSTDQAAMLARLGVDTAEEMFVPEDARDVGELIEIVRPGGPAIPRFLLEDIRRHQFRRNHEVHRALLADLVGLRGAFSPKNWRLPEHSLVVWGSEDPVFPLDVGRELALVLDAELAVIEGAAHGPNFQKPREFNQVVLAWLDGDSR